MFVARRHPLLRWGCVVLLLPMLPVVHSGNLPTPPASPAPTASLRVASLRLPADPQQWLDRREEVRELLEQLQPDVIAAQELLQTPDRLNPACWLAKRLRYSCDFVTADPPSHPRRRGNAILSRIPVIEDGVTLLHPPDEFSAAGMLRMQAGAETVNVYVARLPPGAEAAERRAHQTKDLMAWIRATDGGFPSVIAGDFSTRARELESRLPGFRSSRHAAADSARRPLAQGVLYQSDRFPAAALEMIEVPASATGPALPLGVLMTLQLAQKVAASP